MEQHFTRRELQDALIQTGLSFHWHGHDVQYDSNCTVLPLGWAARRCDTRLTAESAAPDNYVYAVCSDFVHRCYRDAFGYFLADGSNHYLTVDISDVPADDPISVFKFDAATDGQENAERAMEECFRLMEPGDILCYYVIRPSTETRRGFEGGHAMLYIGDYFGDGRKYIVHSDAHMGGKFNAETGDDPEEPIGSVRMQDTNQICFYPPVKKLGMYRYLAKSTRVVLHRPLKFIEEAGMIPTAAAQTRMRFHGLDVRKTLDRSQYTDVRAGETVTVTLALTNRSGDAWQGLTLEEPVPAGQKLVSVTGGGVCDGGTIRWTLNVAPGQKVEVRYAVEAVGAPGDLIRFPAGLVGGGVATRATALKIGCGRLNASRLAALSRVADGAIPAFLKEEPFAGLESAARFFRETVGTEANLPASAQELAELFRSVRLEEAEEDINVFMLRTDAKLPKNLLYKHVSGKYFFGGHNMDERVLEFRERNYLPGDVFVSVHGEPGATYADLQSLVIQILLGSGKVLTLTQEGAEVGNFADTVYRNMRMNLLMAFRPTIA